MRLWFFACFGPSKTTQTFEGQSPMLTQDPVTSCHTRQVPQLRNSISASREATAIPNEYQKTEKMCLQNPDHLYPEVIKVRAIHHGVGNQENGNRFSTVEVIVQLNSKETKHTTMRYSDVIDMLGGKAELKKFGSKYKGPVL